MVVETEVVTVASVVKNAVRSASPRRLVVTVGLLAGIILAAQIQSTAAGAAIVRQCCVVANGSSMWSLMTHLLGSVFAPALNLPIWGALLQVLVVVGIGELVLGWRKVLLVGALCHFAATITGQVLITHSFIVHLDPMPILGDRDTGPSAFVLGVGVYLLLRHGAPRLAQWVILFILMSAAWQIDLAAVEHLAACAVAVAVCLIESPERWKVFNLPGPSTWRKVRGYGVFALLGASMLLITLHTGKPVGVQPSPTLVNDSNVTTPASFELRPRTAVPVWLNEPKDPGAYLSSSPDCRKRMRHQTSVLWRHRVWLCAKPGGRPHKVIVKYDMYGVERIVRVTVPARHRDV